MNFNFGFYFDELVNRNSPAKGAIKAVLPPALPKRIIINDALSSPSRDENGKILVEKNLYLQD